MNLQSDAAPTPVNRHKTAIRRPSFSLPVRRLIQDGLVDASATLFDYGCGHGQDLVLLGELGVNCSGWDPVHRPEADRLPAEIVNLGYVINVIEDPRERADTLRRAWDLTRRLLVVSAQTNLASPDKDLPAYGDGVLTSRGTFQKYYGQIELRNYVEQTLDTDPIPAAPGVLYVFKSDDAKQRYLANRYRRQAAVPPKRVSEVLFEQNLDLLQPFMDVLAALGRLPGPEELPQFEEVNRRFGSLRRAFALVKRVTDEPPWEAIATRRSEDLLVYVALARFHGRPILSKLPLPLQHDVKAFFGTYNRACEQADALLFAVANADAIAQACRRATNGHLVENALLVPKRSLGELEPILRIYEGCARALTGEMEQANVVKLHRYSGKVSYLVYRRAEATATPQLSLRVKVSLRTLSIDFYDHSKTTGSW